MEFLDKNIHSPKGSFISRMVNVLINEGASTCKCWIPYPNGFSHHANDRLMVAKLQKLVDEGVYPQNLLGK